MVREAQRLRTEQRIITAATELFLESGYGATTLEAVAERAGVSVRTVYVRFDTKVRLFQRVIEAGTVGDAEPVPLPQRDWSVQAFTAATLDERIDAFAQGVAAMHERLGPLMAVNNEVEAGEPAVQESAQAARMATIEFLAAFWGGAARDGLLAPEADVEWLVATGATLSAAETRLLITRTYGWDEAAYGEWVASTWRRLVRGAEG